MIRIACIAAAATALVAPAAAATEVTVTLPNVKDRGGALYVALVTEEQFMGPEQAYAAVETEPAAGAHTFTFPDVAPGAYALSVWHDEDGDGVFDSSDAGWPLEGWTMSNKDMLMGPPSFDVVQFAVGDEPVALEARMVYGPAPDGE